MDVFRFEWQRDRRGPRPCLLIPGGPVVMGPPLADTSDRTARDWEARLRDQYRRWRDGARNDLVDTLEIDGTLRCPATF